MSPRGLKLATVLGVWLVTSGAAAADPTKKECAAANESAQDLRRGGKLRDARASFAVCTAATCPGPIREDCAQRLKEVESSTPTIVFEAKDSLGHDLGAVRVTMDGTLLLDKLDGTAIAVDPGQHQFTFEAVGLRKDEESVVLREGEKDRRVRAVLESPVVAVHKGPEMADTGASDGTSRRILGLALGATGAAGIALGSVLGLVAKATYDNALQTECVAADPKNCTAQGLVDGHTAYTQATASTIAFIAGGALLLGGVVIYLTAPASGEVGVTASAANGGGQVSLRGAW
ncbi:MAG: hypothetical protein M3O46_01240 [Myxococcota bacterium]|nr:hypothetical protein [Myxococcota bacterium]